MPSRIGYVGDDRHDKLVRFFEEWEQNSRDSLTEPFTNLTRWWRLYLAKRTVKRLPHESWRSRIHVPYPFSGVESVVASLVDLLTAADPVIQAEGVSSQSSDVERGMSNIFDFVLRKNSFPLFMDKQLRGVLVQGTNAFKVVRGERVVKVNGPRDPQQFEYEKEEFYKRVADGEVASGVAAPRGDTAQDLELFEVWREQVNTQFPHLRIPPAPAPTASMQRYIYRGPVITPVTLTDLRFDPYIGDVDAQPIIIHRVVKNEEWLSEKVKSGVFDAEQVEKALSSTSDDDRFSQWQEEQYTMMGLDPRGMNDPLYHKMHELWEVWRPGDEEAPYCIVLNRKAIVNKDVSHPYGDGQHHIHFLHNVPLEGHALGISEFQQSETLYVEMNRMRELRLDAVLLAVMPIFLRRKDAGIPALQRFLRPGGVFDVSDPNALQALSKANPNLEWAFRELQSIKEDIDETNATPSHFRGAAATVGRVSATESERRFGQSLSRQKHRVVRLEQELSAIVPQIAHMIYNEMPPEMRARAAGGSDPFAGNSAHSLLEVLEMDFRFRGATQALNKDLQIQQLNEWFKSSANYLDPSGALKVLEKLYTLIGQKDVERVITSEQKGLIQKEYELTKQVALANLAMQAAQLQMMQSGNVPVPGQVSGGTAEAVNAEAEEMSQQQPQQPTAEGGAGGGGEAPPAAAEGYAEGSGSFTNSMDERMAREGIN